ncbi:N-acetylmuramoyl-L-alanine amidase [Paenibacillus solisilvae]|uniref:N-acetylmuramoyl-L-alanine amidase n=1 Tax=Paenibacillus solisilvae TaxID=2486751 RepID=A0ABW0W0G0_9BACL
MKFHIKSNRCLMTISAAALMLTVSLAAFGFAPFIHAAPADHNEPSVHKQHATYDQDQSILLPPQYQRALPTAEVLIDVGHGGIDGGAHHENLLEKDINLAVSKKLYTKLRASGIRTILNRNGDYALSDDNRWHRSHSRHQRDLSQRSQLTKEIQTQIVVSLHVNWAADSTARGPLVLHQNEGESAFLAFCIQDTLNRGQRTRQMPRIGKPFYLLNVVKQPAVIVEMGYISHAGDRQMLTDPREQAKIADAIASGVRNYILLR